MKMKKAFNLNSCFAFLISLISFIGIASGQDQGVTLLELRPPGGKQGSEIEIEVRTSNCELPSHLEFNHSALRASAKASQSLPLDLEPLPLSNKLQLKIPSDVPPGIYQARLVCESGISNSRKFEISPAHIEEVWEKENNNSALKAQAIKLGTVVSGSISSRGDVDHYQLEVKEKQTVVFSLKAKQLDSRLEAKIRLFDPRDGRHLKSIEGTSFNDPYLVYQAKESGPVTIVVQDALFHGSPDFHYRLEVDERPQVEFVLPPFANPDGSTKGSVYGFNLPGAKLAQAYQNSLPGLQVIEAELKKPEKTVLSNFLDRPHQIFKSGFFFSLHSAGKPSNPYFIEWVKAATDLETEPNDTPDKATPVKAPIHLAGQLLSGADEDWIQFEAVPGKTHTITLNADRRGSPIDGTLILEEVNKNAKGEISAKEISFADDPKDLLSTNKLSTQHYDPSISFKAKDQTPALYRLRIADNNSSRRADPRHLYHVSIKVEEPRFQLLAQFNRLVADPKKTPPAWDVSNIQKASTCKIDVYLKSLHGFNKPVTVKVEGLPPMISCKEITLKGGRAQGSLIFKASPDAKNWNGVLTVVGEVEGEPYLKQKAIIPELIWPSVTERGKALTRGISDLAMNLRDDPPLLTIQPEGDKPIRIIRGGQVKLPIKLIRTGGSQENVKIKLFQQPGGFSAKEIQINKGKDLGTMDFKANNNTPVGTQSVSFTGQTRLKYTPFGAALRKVEEHRKKVAELVDLKKKQLKEVSDGEKKKVEEELKAVNAALKAADDRLKSVKNKAKPKNVDTLTPSQVFTIEVLDLPFTWKISEQGFSVGKASALSIEVKREVGFADIIKVQPLGKLPEGVEIKTLQINKDKTSGNLEIKVGEAFKGDSLEFELEAQARFANQDRKAKLKVALKKIPPKEDAGKTSKETAEKETSQ